MNKIDIRQLENQLINSSKSTGRKQINLNKDFGQILEKIQNKDEEIKFSKHATERLNSREMNLTMDEINRLKSAFCKAESKGVKDALILMDDKAFIANINKKTIITTVNKEQLKENIFTNIDGAVII
ncbi:TIGR02530 family flagellar biosynthesis protein [Tissierella praeacuta]|uniref:Flagellar operon protein n=1 Tax=Tissierella praeacuta DSM 18095 TaxID=1123404 RepID=A0A1M4SLM2_9FIRM|nr:TIGR02530 family flagellar biosynthesis protein [Tissierella praeacuta]TCU70586.1 flagellar operon protein [Tissierella praeacuta]SHE33085.1 flagellar operon protein [Tissierella praeacuta DSM 18095]SUP01547.1 flagellar operon protein [Tissierella praeacuta]